MSTDRLSDVRKTYDAVAPAYADRFTGELAGKPLDRALLSAFSERIPRGGLVLDIGCGPGHVTAHLAGLGVRARGVDLSAGMIAEATSRFPGLDFTVGQLPGLNMPDGELAGAVLFYSIIHMDAELRAEAFSELGHALAPGGPVLIAFHIGDEMRHVQEWLGQAVSLDGYMLPPATVAGELAAAGLVIEAELERAGYPGPEASGTRRCYILASRPA